MDDDIWIRLPEEGSRCPHSGLARTSLRELVLERHPITGEFFVETVLKKKEGATRGVFLIRLSSLKIHLERLADQQRGLRWADHITNPNGYLIADVLVDLELFSLFIGPDNLIAEDEWFEGKLSTRQQRILTLCSAGVLVLDDSRS